MTALNAASIAASIAAAAHTACAADKQVSVVVADVTNGQCRSGFTGALASDVERGAPPVIQFGTVVERSAHAVAGFITGLTGWAARTAGLREQPVVDPPPVPKP